jgi:hypothetical protein
MQIYDFLGLLLEISKVKEKVWQYILELLAVGKNSNNL